ncbi:MAG: NAD(P)/FAD-dependent oxidoreductase [Verrucomicrobiales bacterium]
MVGGEQVDDCIVVGAGIAGLMAARTLHDAGLKVRVLEKGRGLGGRMASRRRDGATFDHGAQFFTVRDPRFEFWVEQWLRAGAAVPWYDLPKSGRHFRAAPGMTGIAKHVAQGLNVETQRKLNRVRHSTDRSPSWEVETAEHGSYHARALILTPPVPQSLELLDAGEFRLPPASRARLEELRYHRCIAAMAILDRPSAITDHSGALKLDGEPIQWIADNQRKGVSPDVPSVTIHSTPAFAERHWDHENSERIPILLDAAATHLGANVVSSDGHRWGFSQPISAYGEEAFFDGQRNLAIAGDGLVGGRVEGAVLSGLAAAGAIRLALEQS